MARRSNPWPALVDLYGGLLMVCLGGMLLLASSYQAVTTEAFETAERMRDVVDLRHKVEVILRPIGETDRAANTLVSTFRTCEEDQCLDLQIHFDSREDRIKKEEERQQLHSICGIVRAQLLQIPPDQRKLLHLVVEGHADKELNTNFPTERDEFVYNWNLSSRRAASVLFELCECGIFDCARGEVLPDKNEGLLFSTVRSIGYGSSLPLCTEGTEECNERNRRTTLRIRVDEQRTDSGLDPAID